VRLADHAQLTVAGVIGADLADVVLDTSIASGPDPVEPTALPHCPVPPLAVAAPHRDDLAVLFASLAAVSLPDPPVYWP
jgi:hypothetical protein